MYIFLLTISFAGYFASAIFAARFKSRLSDEVILEYEKNVRPRFIYHYMAGVMIPMVVLLALNFNQPLSLYYWFWPILSGTVAIDLLVLLRIRSVIRASNYPGQLSAITWLVVCALQVIICFLIALRLYYSQYVH